MGNYYSTELAVDMTDTASLLLTGRSTKIVEMRLEVEGFVSRVQPIDMTLEFLSSASDRCICDGLEHQSIYLWICYCQYYSYSQVKLIHLICYCMLLFLQRAPQSLNLPHDFLSGA